jgi:hypothetical protein
MATAFVTPWTSLAGSHEPAATLVPTLKAVFVTTDGRTLRERFLVDSGADISMAPRRLCDLLGLDWHAGEPVSLNGISPRPECAVAARVLAVEMLVPEIGIALVVPICFADGDVSQLLGREEFFDCFRITFDKRRLTTQFELIEETPGASLN